MVSPMWVRVESDDPVTGATVRTAGKLKSELRVIYPRALI